MAVDDFSDTLYPPRERPPAPRFTVLDALRRQIGIALLPVIVLIGIAVAIGMLRTPVYISEARLNVGGLNLTQQSIEGYTAAVQQLAVAYARSIDATGVATPVGRRLDLAPQTVVDRVSAEPIQNTPVVRVLATGSDARQTEALADLSADSLVNYAIRLNSGRSASGRLLDRYRSASRDFQRANSQLGRVSKGSPRRGAVETRVDLARLERQTVGFLYQQSQAGQAATQLVQKLAPADKATSDRGKILRDYVAGGAIAGVLIGIGLAVARANALARRRLGES